MLWSKEIFLTFLMSPWVSSSAQQASICAQNFCDFSRVGRRYVAQSNRFRLIASLFRLDMSELWCPLETGRRSTTFARHRQWCSWDCGCSTTQQSTLADVCGCASTSKGPQRECPEGSAGHPTFSAEAVPQWLPSEAPSFNVRARI